MECRKLPTRLPGPVALAALLVSSGSLAGALAQDAPGTRPDAGVGPGPTASELFSAPLTVQARAELRAALGVGLVEVRRRLEPAPGTFTPAPPTYFGVAGCMTDGALWTSFALVEGLEGVPPVEVLAVRGGDGGPEPGEWRPVRVERPDRELGLAALRLVDATARGVACPGGQTRSSAVETGGLFFGRRLYAAVPGDPGLRSATVQGPGREPLSWYLAADGDPLPPGTPVFDARGRWLSLAGPRALDSEVRSHLVPTAAVDAWLVAPKP